MEGLSLFVTCLKKLANHSLFFFSFVFLIQLTVNVQHKFCRLLDLNFGPLESEVTALNTEPQPLYCLFEVVCFNPVTQYLGWLFCTFICCKIVLKDENNTKEAGVALFFKAW